MMCLSDDEVFEGAEQSGLRAVTDGGWAELHAHFDALSKERETPGFKKRSGMSQNDRILSMLQRGETITRLIAMHYGIMNLTARIAELRNAGHDVRCKLKADDMGRSYGEFYLVGVAA